MNNYKRGKKIELIRLFKYLNPPSLFKILKSKKKAYIKNCSMIYINIYQISVIKFILLAYLHKT